MTKNRCRVLICLFVGAAVLVGGFFLVRWWLRPEIWINISHVGSFVLTNDRGETLVKSHGEFSGTMEILDFQGGFGVYRYRVSDSDFFAFQPKSDNMTFSVEWGDDFTFFAFEKAAKVTISRSSVFAEGNLTNYMVSAFTEADSTMRYILRGNAAEWVRLERSASEASAESSSAYTFALRDLYATEALAQHDSPDGAAFTLYNSTE